MSNSAPRFSARFEQNGAAASGDRSQAPGQKLHRHVIPCWGGRNRQREHILIQSREPGLRAATSICQGASRQNSYVGGKVRCLRATQRCFTGPYGHAGFTHHRGAPRTVWGRSLEAPGGHWSHTPKPPHHPLAPLRRWRQRSTTLQTRTFSETL